MSEIQYQVAKTVKEAVKMMQAAKGKGYVLAGGTDLLVQMKSGMRAPGVIVTKAPASVSPSSVRVSAPARVRGPVRPASHRPRRAGRRRLDRRTGGGAASDEIV